MNKKYGDVNQLKNVFKSIITRTVNGEKIKEPYQKMVMKLLFSDLRNS